MTATEPPVRGDHRSTWLMLLIVAALFLSAVIVAVLVAPK